MPQLIEAPDAADIDRIARLLLHAEQLTREIAGEPLTGGLSDLPLLQRLLADARLARDQTVALQALGLALGKVFVQNETGYDWWMVEDEHGRDPAVRFGQTSLLFFPQTMISKRVEQGHRVDVAEMYTGLRAQLEALRAELFPET
ncbi:MAG: DUF3806 domain-containing protein [Gammaproteobacteria bacterium]|nr:DUF3806 domain-containing protein [Gammaproteobacteria bacterium]